MCHLLDAILFAALAKYWIVLKCPGMAAYIKYPLENQSTAWGGALVAMSLKSFVTGKVIISILLLLCSYIRILH